VGSALGKTLAEVHHLAEAYVASGAAGTYLAKLDNLPLKSPPTVIVIKPRQVLQTIQSKYIFNF